MVGKGNFGWDLPPGVRACDLPGNRPEDQEVELWVTLTQGELEQLKEEHSLEDAPEDLIEQLVEQRPRLTKKLLRTVVEKRIEIIKQDSRYQAKPAIVDIDAPLALTQVALETELHTLTWVLSQL